MTTRYRRVAGTVRITKDGGIDKTLPGSAVVDPRHEPSVGKLLRVFFSKCESFMPGDEHYRVAQSFKPHGSRFRRYAIRLGSYMIVCMDTRKGDPKFDWYLDWYHETGDVHPKRQEKSDVRKTRPRFLEIFPVPI